MTLLSVQVFKGCPLPQQIDPSGSRRRVQDPDQLWEHIQTDMGILVEVYQDFATITAKSVDRPVGPRRLKVLDMASLIKPTSYPGCVQRLMTAISAKALHECFDGALDAVDYDIADNLCKASRALMNRYCQIIDTRDDGPSPTEAHKCACKKFMEDARRYLQMWQQMTEGDGVATLIDLEWSDDSYVRFEQFVQRVAANGVVNLTVDVVMQYMQAAQTSRAVDKLQDFLVQVKRMTRALGSAMDNLEVLQ